MITRTEIRNLAGDKMNIEYANGVLILTLYDGDHIATFVTSDNNDVAIIKNILGVA